MNFNSKKRAFLRKIGSTEQPIVRIGKEGYSETIAQSLEIAFNTRELVKVKMLNNSDEDLKEVANKLAEATKAQIVHIMGGTVLFYRENKEKPTISLQLKGI